MFTILSTINGFTYVKCDLMGLKFNNLISDYNELLKSLSTESFNYSKDFYNSKVQQDDFDENDINQLSECDFWLVLKDNKIVSIMCAYYHKELSIDSTVISQVYTMPQFRGLSLAYNNLSLAIKEFKSKNLAIYLGVIEGNPAIKLYEKLGFKCTHKTMLLN